MHLRETETAQDVLITSLIIVARQWCEAYENTKYITQEITAKYNVLRQQMCLPFGKAQSITSLKYIDSSEIQQTISSDDYLLDDYSVPPVLYAAHGVTFPTALNVRNAVEIIYIAGYGDASSDVPERIKEAMKLILTHLYEHREQDIEVSLTEMPMNAKHFLFERELY